MDFKFIENTVSKKWVIYSPRRAKRPDMANGTQNTCPFCLGNETNDKETYRIGGNANDVNWKVRVVNNKFPFAPIHEVIVHSPDHHKNFDELPLNQIQLILEVFRQRFNTFKDRGNVFIFHNHGVGGGESLTHPHSQLVVVPDNIPLDVPGIDFSKDKEGFHSTQNFTIFAPLSSQWPDEVWVKPNREVGSFGEITDKEIKDLSKALYRLIQIFDLRHGSEFAYNFYISPFKDWYLRIIPRQKTLGGFEVGTGIWVNTQDPKETIAFIKEHFDEPNEEKIRLEHRAQYHKAV